MKIEKLLVAAKDGAGEYVSVDDWQNVTVQIAAAEKDKPFAGTVTIEGTLSTDPGEAVWTPLLISKSEEMLNLSGFALAGLRASVAGMSAGTVLVLVAGR